MLNQWYHLDLTHVVEKFVELLLTLHVEDHVGAEHENGCTQDWEDFETFEADNSIVNKVKLINFKLTYEAVEHPREGSTEGLNTKLTQVVAHVWFVHLEKVLKKFSQTQDTLWVTRHSLQLAVVLCKERSEDVISVFLLIANVAERRYQARKVLDGQHSTWREEADRLVRRANNGDGGMRFTFENVPDLSVSEEELHARFHHILEDEILVIIARFKDISVDQVIQCCFPL